MIRRAHGDLRLAGILALVAVPVFASDHLVVVNEVLLSANADDTVQYIELHEPSNEPFPSGPYWLVIYDALGVFQGEVETVGIAAATPGQYLVGTVAADAEFGTTRNATLPIVLPRDGQACFERQNDTIISCLRWGCIDTVIGGGASVAAESPPDDLSTQRQAAGTPHVAAPTPGAPNTTGVAITPCTIVFFDSGFESGTTDNWSEIEPP